MIWAGLGLVVLGLVLVVLSLWPAKLQVWEVCCHGCGWSGTLSGPAVNENVARMFAGAHAERTGHLVEARTEL